jgi:alkanesulfonate monooxygenase SsuD/methylene tetrahydromethanopterin reductase-like flavin-dependent oxidoreductase (luciferase family)
MKFGLFMELEYPRPWEPDGEQRLIGEALEQAELAEHLGLDSVWAVEHHFLEEYSHCSAPEVYLSAVAARTKRIRIGHGVCLLPVGYNAPARIAERIGMLDLVSGGRVELGTGESNSRMELEGYGVDVGTKRAQWTEAVEQIANMLAMDPYPGFEGEFFSMPARNVVPKTVQKPHPPMWVACSNKQTIHLAARLGLGALAFTFLKPEDAKKWVDEYYEILKTECVPIAHTINPNILLVTGFGVHHETEVAVDRFLDGIRFFQYGLNHYYRAGVHKPGRTDVWAEFLANREAVLKYDYDPVMGKNVATSIGAIGDVEQVRAWMKGFADIGIDELVFIQQGGKNKHEHICESLELFAAEIMEEFQAGEQERQARKLEELAPYIEQAFERKADKRPLRLPDDEIPEYETIAYGAHYVSKEAVLGTVQTPVAR